MRRILACTLVAAVAPSAFAGITISGSSGASWQAFPTSLNVYGTTPRPYWDQNTKDTTGGGPTNRNVGNYLNGTWTGALPAGAAPLPLSSPSWWGRDVAGGFEASQDLDVFFQMGGSGTTVASTLKLELAGHHALNEIGWYSLSDGPGAETLHAIFAGPDSAPTDVTFTPAAAFGLYIKTGGGQVFFTQASRNRTAAGQLLPVADLETQHFAIFAADLTPGAERYTIGVEDLPRSQAGVEVIGDYNDVIFTITAVPTPGAAAGLIAGLCVLGRRRR